VNRFNILEQEPIVCMNVSINQLGGDSEEIFWRGRKEIDELDSIDVDFTILVDWFGIRYASFLKARSMDLSNLYWLLRHGDVNGILEGACSSDRIAMAIIAIDHGANAWETGLYHACGRSPCLVNLMKSQGARVCLKCGWEK
jgi:hypothetical protein